MFKTGKISIWIILLILFSATAGKINAQSPVVVEDHIQGGLQWLRDTQGSLGSWHHDNIAGVHTNPTGWGVGTAGLAVLAFLENGGPPSDDVVCDALNYILGQVKPTTSTVGAGAIYQSTSDIGFVNKPTYQTAIAVLALVEAEKQCIEGCDLPPGTNLHDVIQDAVDYIVASQFPNTYLELSYRGGFGYCSMADYSISSSHESPDISNTQFALWSLCIAKGAGYVVPDNVWSNALPWVLDRQHPGGGFDYFIYSEITEARTAAGLMCLWFIRCWIGDITSIADIDNAADNALTYWQHNYSYVCNTTYGIHHTYYFILSAARAFHYWGSLAGSPGSAGTTGEAYSNTLGIPFGTVFVNPIPGGCPASPFTPPLPFLHSPTIELAGGEGLPAWYRDFALALTHSAVVAVGPAPSACSWPDTWGEGGETISTLYAILALSRINLPPYCIITGDKIRPIVDRTVPCDGECVCCDDCEEEDFLYICAHIQDGCCSKGINARSIKVEIGSECCVLDSIPFSFAWIPDHPGGTDNTSGTVRIRVKCDSLCNMCPEVYNLSYKVYVCIRAEDIAGNELFPNPYTWSFTINKDRPRVEMYHPLCLTCEDYGPHVVWPQNPCCVKNIWDGYYQFTTYHQCNLDCDTIKITTWTGGVPSGNIFTPPDTGIYYNEYFCTGELDSIKVDLIEALDFPWIPPVSDTISVPPLIYTVDTCFDSLRVCLAVCDESLDLSHINADGVCLPETVVCHRDTCCWMFHNVHIYRRKLIRHETPIQKNTNVINPF